MPPDNWGVILIVPPALSLIVSNLGVGALVDISGGLGGIPHSLLVLTHLLKIVLIRLHVLPPTVIFWLLSILVKSFFVDGLNCFGAESICVAENVSKSGSFTVSVKGLRSLGPNDLAVCL